MAQSWGLTLQLLSKAANRIWPGCWYCWLLSPSQTMTNSASGIPKHDYNRQCIYPIGQLPTPVWYERRTIIPVRMNDLDACLRWHWVINYFVWYQSSRMEARNEGALCSWRKPYARARQNEKRILCGLIQNVDIFGNLIWWPSSPQAGSCDQKCYLLSTHCGHAYHQMCHKQTPRSPQAEPKRPKHLGHLMQVQTNNYDSFIP